MLRSSWGNPSIYAKQENFFSPLTSPIQPPYPGCWDQSPQGVNCFFKTVGWGRAGAMGCSFGPGGAAVHKAGLKAGAPDPQGEHRREQAERSIRCRCGDPHSPALCRCPPPPHGPFRKPPPSAWTPPPPLQHLAHPPHPPTDPSQGGGEGRHVAGGLQQHLRHLAEGQSAGRGTGLGGGGGRAKRRPADTGGDYSG